MMSPAAWVGIDVGGTFTDAVAVRAGEVVAVAKQPTQAHDLSPSLLGALDQVLRQVSGGPIARLSLSTTLITNLLAQGQAPPVAALLIPGPGRDPATFSVGGPAWAIGGAIDFRGREIAPLDRTEVEAALRQIQATGCRHLAITGKFSPRNPGHEIQVQRWAAEWDPDWQLCAGHTVAGQLNFERRAAAAVLTLAVREPYRDFFAQIRQALADRGLECPIVILKADGGTLPLHAAELAPLQSIFSGPAASTMGVLAQRPPGSTSVVVDVGGTTTDLALILDGEPLFSSVGGTVLGSPGSGPAKAMPGRAGGVLHLPIRAFAVRSLPLGGDSTVAVHEGQVRLLPTRAGVAACLGGPAPTLTDALRLLGRTRLGDVERARAALASVGAAADLDALAVATQAVELALSRLEAGIADMFRTWQREQIYRIWQLKQRGQRHPDTVVGVGAAAEPLVPALAERLAAQVLIPPYAAVANALGAALARPTFTTTLHIDTEQRILQVLEEGLTEKLPDGDYTLQDAEQLARNRAARRGAALGIADPLADLELVLAEQFNVLDGWTTVGRIIDVRLERRCGLIKEWKR